MATAEEVAAELAADKTIAAVSAIAAEPVWATDWVVGNTLADAVYKAAAPTLPDAIKDAIKDAVQVHRACSRTIFKGDVEQAGVAETIAKEIVLVGRQQAVAAMDFLAIIFRVVTPVAADSVVLIHMGVVVI